MKLIFVTHDSTFTGATSSLIKLVEQIVNLNFEILLLVPEQGALTDYLNKKKIAYKTTGHRINTSKETLNLGLLDSLRSKKFKWQRFLENRFKAIRVKSYIISWKPDFIITNTSTTLFGAILAKKCKIGHIWYLREYGYLDHGFRQDFRKKFSKYLAKAKINICISKVLEKHFRDNYQINNTKVVYNGIYTLKEIDVLRSINSSSKNQFLTFIFLGQITERKGVYKVLNAFYKISNNSKLKLLIVGDGPELHNLKLEIKKLQLENKVILTGYANDVKKFLQEADFFVMASDNEAFGRTTIEAIVNDCIVIANNKGATPELFNEEVIFFESTVEDLCEKMKLILDMSAEKQKDLKKSALKKVKSNFTSENMTDSFLVTLNSL